MHTMSIPMEEKAVIEFAENVECLDSPGGHLLIDTNGQIQQLPIPSKDPNDPLNFTKWEKIGIIVACCWFCEFPRSDNNGLLTISATMSLTLVGGLGPILRVFFEMYLSDGHTTNQVVWLSTFPSLFVGIGSYHLLSLALYRIDLCREFCGSPTWTAVWPPLYYHCVNDRLAGCHDRMCCL